MFNKISAVISASIKYLTMFFLVFVWVNFYLRKFLSAFFIALFITIIIALIIEKFALKKHNKAKLSNSEKNEIKKHSQNLLVITNKEVCNLFATILKHLGYTKIKLFTNYVEYEANEKKEVLFPYYITSQIKNENIFEILKKLNKKNYNKINICCVDYSAESAALAKQIKNQNITLQNQTYVYKQYFQKTNIYPFSELKIEQSKIENFKQLLAIIFNKRKAKYYIYSGITLLFASLVTPFSLYYVISSSVLFFMALFCQFNTRFNTETQT